MFLKEKKTFYCLCKDFFPFLFICSGMDIFSTILSLAGVDPPSDRHYDGIDVTDILLHGSDTGHKAGPLLETVEQQESVYNREFGIQNSTESNLLFSIIRVSCTQIAGQQGSLETCRLSDWDITKLFTLQVWYNS